MTPSSKDLNSTEFFWIDVCGVRISAINIPLACEAICRWVQEKRHAYVCVAPVSTIVECQENKDYKKIINNANMVTPDGMPLVWYGRWKGNKIIRRTYGPDLMLTLCEAGQKTGVRHYFYGGTEKTLDLLKEKLRQKFPDIKVVGQHAPPFRSLTLQEDDSIVEEINRLNPDIVWVGLGSPKQDFWMEYHRNKIQAPVMIAVGAAFNFLSGVVPQAPKWMQNRGLEWIFRLCSEPRRLWKRYLVGNTKFVFYVLKDFFRNRENEI